MSLSDGVSDMWRAELHSVVGTMQEAVLVLAAVREDECATVVDYRVVVCNEVAARALDVESIQLVGRALSTLFAPDTSRLMFQLCGEAAQLGEAVQYFAAAPDPLTDLSRSPSVAVQVAAIGDSIVCTWMPGWPSAAEHHDGPQKGVSGRSTADRLELATALDTLGNLGFGVFSLDLMTGRVIGSDGLYEVLGRRLGSRPAERIDVQCLVESVVAGVDAWQDLLRTGAPMDVEVHLDPQLGGYRVRLTGRVFRGSDGHPAVVRGSFCLLDR